MIPLIQELLELIAEEIACLEGAAGAVEVPAPDREAPGEGGPEAE